MGDQPSQPHPLTPRPAGQHRSSAAGYASKITLEIGQTMRKVSDNRYQFSDGSTVTLSYAGQLPDGDFPGGTRTAYEYEIRDASGGLVSRDTVNGGVGMEFPLREAWATWASFMVAWADTYRGAMRRQSETTLDGDPITPEHEWAYQNEDEVQELEYEDE